jgi:enamine deaminase RidA (YjgF/YER057c/UK114 family)
MRLTSPGAAGARHSSEPPGCRPETVEITAVALRNLAHKKVMQGQDTGEPVSAGILTHDRLFVSGMRGRDLKTGKVPDDPGAQVDLALDGMKAVCEAAGISLAHMVFVNPYLTNRIPLTVMNMLYAKRFEFGNTPARATIQVSTLPENPTSSSRVSPCAI